MFKAMDSAARPATGTHTHPMSPNSLLPLGRVLASLVVTTGLGILVSGCSDKEAPIAVTPPVRTFVLEGGTDTRFRRFPGEVAAADTSRMSFDVPGRIIDFPAQQGLVVKQGALLAQLDQTNFIARFDAARALFNSASEEFNRRRVLLQRRVISQSEFEQFQKAYNVADADLRTAQRALDDTRLVAPFDGRVAQTIANNFQNVQAQEPVLVFQNISTLEVDIQVPESDMSLAIRGITAENARELLEAKVEFAALPGEQFDLELKSFATQASASARTFQVTFTLHPPENKNILPGMTCTVLLRMRDRSGLSDGQPGVYRVPTHAVSTQENKTWVWRLDPATMKVSRIPVDMLGLSGEAIQIRSPKLQSGDELVASGVRFLSDGMTVRRMDASNR